MLRLYKAANKATTIRPYETENVKITLYCQLYNCLLTFSDTYGLMGVALCSRNTVCSCYCICYNKDFVYGQRLYYYKLKSLSVPVNGKQTLNNNNNNNNIQN